MVAMKGHVQGARMQGPGSCGVEAAAYRRRAPATMPAALLPPNHSLNRNKPPLLMLASHRQLQYSDKEDGASFHGTPRYYRYALQQLDRAVNAMREAGVVFAVHLGAWRSGGYGAHCGMLCGMLEAGTRASHQCTACAAGRSVNMLCKCSHCPLGGGWLIPALPASSCPPFHPLRRRHY